jgi:hypothetical protein
VAISSRIGGPAGDLLAATARSSFVEALAPAAVVAAAIAIATAVFVIRAMPPRAALEPAPEAIGVEGAAAGRVPAGSGAGH